ncbi:centromere protein J-like [Vespa mandarinia]|uniref:centromere protein J-like n=1 Tax=Vespa mandarinia TaxID=7446 RepID=UPI00160F3D17|nr:centromere protein J-like [Vespa mandarinia]XP_035737864.1 centromere protein J-like [Vespa mandarinia]
MDLETSLVERLQKLRQWQIEQQERLTRQQQEQRQKLTQEQLRMYEVLRLPIQEIGFDNRILCENSWYEDAHLSANTTDHADDCKQEQIDKDVKKIIQEQSTNDNNNINKSDYISLFTNSNISTIDESFQEEKSLTELKKSSNDVGKQTLSKPKYQEENEKDNAKNDCNSNNENIYITSQKKKIHLIDHLLEGIEPLPPDKPVNKSFLIDDIPVPSPKKDFKTLLEEKLKEYKPIFNKESNDKIQNQIKRPFLKKGQGLARFRMIQTSKNIPVNVKSCAIPVSIKQIAKKQINPTNNKNDNTKNKPKLSKNVPSRKCIAAINVVQQQLNLKNVPPPKKIYSEKNEAVLANIESSINSNIIEINSSDIDLKTQREMEEIRIFELLEEKAENSSLCSTSSTVVAFLQQSTPFKIRQKIRDTEDNINNPIQQDIVHKISPRRLQLTDTQSIPSNQKTESDVNSFWETIPIKNPNEILENNQILKKQNTSNVLKNEKSDQMFIQNHIEHIHDEINCDIQNSVYSNEIDVGLHVRFSEYNEYKTIGLTDNSSISSTESLSQKDYNDERAWSDCSELSDSSDTNVQLIKSRTFKTNEVANEACDFTNTYTNKIMKEEIDQHEIKKTQETIFKSELLKNRLLELEKEIDIFRKENAALSSQRHKLQEDYRCFLKEIKEKKLILEDNKKRIDCLEEEKRKLIREKTVLESRLRDSQEKAHQNKLERQQIQDLKEQLEKLQIELRSKESKWNAAQARHRSQMRILKMENIKLKEEVERLIKTKTYNPKTTKSIGTFSNTKALHQINKQLSEEMKEVIKNDSSLEDDDKMSKTMLDAINLEHEYVKSDYEIDSHSNEDHNRNSNKSNINISKEYEQCMQNIIKKRNLYENLLKNATSSSIEVSNVIKASELNKLKCEANGSRKNQNKKENGNSKSQIDKDTCMDEKDKVTLNYENDDDIIKISQKLPLTSISSKELLHAYKRTISPKEFKTNEQVQCIEHPNGCTELWYPNGNVKKIFPDKSITKMLYYNGDVRETQKDGKVKYFYASTRTWHTTMPDGLEILEFPNGQVEKRSQNGMVEISFPDGSMQIIKVDGYEKWKLPDGTIAETFANGEKVVILPNGQREIHTKDHKRREYPDGTIKLVYPDGIQETRYSNGRIRLKDQAGNLLMDSHY